MKGSSVSPDVVCRIRVCSK